MKTVEAIKSESFSLKYVQGIYMLKVNFIRSQTFVNNIFNI